MPPGRVAEASAAFHTAWLCMLQGLKFCLNMTFLDCRYAPQLVKRVIEDVLVRLGRPSLHVADMPVDLERRVADVLQRLSEQPPGSPAVLGLHGMGGIGKTTLAKAVFNALHSEFAGCSCFLEVGSETNQAALHHLQRHMLKELCGVEREIISVDAGKAELERRLRGSTVLLVIDDIWFERQRDALLVPLGAGSRVILTTRNAQLLRSSSHPGILSQPVGLLDSQAALELFSWHAFLAKEPPSRYSELAAKAVKYCEGLPLTLTVLGTYLWDQPDAVAWEAALKKLRAAHSLTRGRPEQDQLWGKLRLSYDALGAPEQQMFLDIACCMLGRQVSTVLPAWGPGAHTALRNLVGRSLVIMDDSDQLKMNEQLRNMAREIVVTENRQAPALRSRIWMPEALQVVNGEQVRLLVNHAL